MPPTSHPLATYSCVLFTYDSRAGLLQEPLTLTLTRTLTLTPTLTHVQVSSKNLFDGSAKPEPKAGAAPVAEEAEGGVDTMQQMFTDFNIDRKVGQP